VIAKLVKGRGFRGALEYNLTQEKGRVIDSNMAGQNPRELAAEFGVIRKLRPKLGKAVLHVSLSAALGEQLSDKQWRDISQRYLHGMGFHDNQFLVIRHTDTAHEHVHILVNRIKFSGEVVSDSQDYKRQEVLMRGIEQDYGLHRVAPSIEAKCRAPTKGEIEQGLRTGQPSTRQQLQQLCDVAARDCHSFTAYAERLEAVGVALVPVAQLEGAKLSGLSYRLDGVTMKGSDLGKGYSPAGLAKRGVSYEQNRDFAAVRRSLERETVRVFGEPDRVITGSQAPQRGDASRDVGTFSAGNGCVDGRDAADAVRNRPQELGAKRAVQPPDQRSGPALEGRGSGSATGRRQPEPSRAADGVAALRASGADGRTYGGARDRVLALVGPAQNRESAPARPARGSRVSETRPDRTATAIQRQITALGGERFEIGIRDQKTGRMMNREWERAEIERNTAWLKRMNARGNDVYIRPAGAHGLVLVDDLKPEALEQMKAKGFAPAATIETSPGNYQAWVKLSDTPVSDEMRRMAARGLAKSFGGDPNSADIRHYGRLVGLTNQKPEYRHAGRQPYVLAHDCSGKAARGALAYLARLDTHVDKVMTQQEQTRRLEAIKTAHLPLYGADPIHEYQRHAQRLLERYGSSADLSRLDWMISTDMAKSGRFTQFDIEKAILECSPNVESRKVGHIEDYAKRTAEKAWNAPEVLEYRKQQETMKQTACDRARNRGMGFER